MNIRIQSLLIAWLLAANANAQDIILDFRSTDWLGAACRLALTQAARDNAPEAAIEPILYEFALRPDSNASQTGSLPEAVKSALPIWTGLIAGSFTDEKPEKKQIVVHRPSVGKIPGILGVRFRNGKITGLSVRMDILLSAPDGYVEALLEATPNLVRLEIEGLHFETLSSTKLEKLHEFFTKVRLRLRFLEFVRNNNLGSQGVAFLIKEFSADPADIERYQARLRQGWSHVIPSDALTGGKTYTWEIPPLEPYFPPLHGLMFDMAGVDYDSSMMLRDQGRFPFLKFLAIQELKAEHEYHAVLFLMQMRWSKRYPILENTDFEKYPGFWK